MITTHAEVIKAVKDIMAPHAETITELKYYGTRKGSRRYTITFDNWLQINIQKYKRYDWTYSNLERLTEMLGPAYNWHLEVKYPDCYYNITCSMDFNATSYKRAKSFLDCLETLKDCMNRKLWIDWHKYNPY